MKRHSLLFISVATIITVFISSTTAMYSSSVIEKLKPTSEEIPDGYMFGQVPDFAQSLLKNNPWSLDQAAIKKLTNRIYPGGEYTKVSDLHMTIITNKKNPYGDDIVCYIFIFRNEKSAQEELAKAQARVAELEAVPAAGGPVNTAAAEGDDKLEKGNSDKPDKFAEQAAIAKSQPGTTAAMNARRRLLTNVSILIFFKKCIISFNIKSVLISSVIRNN